MDIHLLSNRHWPLLPRKQILRPRWGVVLDLSRLRNGASGFTLYLGLLGPICHRPDLRCYIHHITQEDKRAIRQSAARPQQQHGKLYHLLDLYGGFCSKCCICDRHLFWLSTGLRSLWCCTLLSTYCSLSLYAPEECGLTRTMERPTAMLTLALPVP